MKKIFMIMLLATISVIVMPVNAFAYTLSYDANGGTGTMEPTTDLSGSTSITKQNEFTAPEGKLFVGWSFKKYANKADIITGSFNMDEDKTVYAVWFTKIKEANATIATPIGGFNPDINPETANGYLYTTGGSSSLTDASWSTDFNYFTEFSSSNTFVTGTDYTLFMAFRAADGYCFTDETVFKINGNVATEFSTTGNSKFIRGEKYKFTAISAENATVNVSINDYSTLNRGKFSIANDINSNKPESTSSLSVNLYKGSHAILYITPETNYSIEKITVDGNEVSFVKETSLLGVDKPYKVVINMEGTKNVVIYFKIKKTLKYELTTVKKNTNVNEIAKNINKEQFINEKKTAFINELNNFKTGKENVTSLSDDVISSLFTENKYAVITNIKYKDSSYLFSSDIVGLGDYIGDWDNFAIVQGWVEKTNKYDIEYTEITLVTEEETNPKTSDNILTSIILGSISLISICGLYIKKREIL